MATQVRNDPPAERATPCANEFEVTSGEIAARARVRSSACRDRYPLAGGSQIKSCIAQAAPERRSPRALHELGSSCGSTRCAPRRPPARAPRPPRFGRRPDGGPATPPALDFDRPRAGRTITRLSKATPRLLTCSTRWPGDRHEAAQLPPFCSRCMATRRRRPLVDRRHRSLGQGLRLDRDRVAASGWKPPTTGSGCSAADSELAEGSRLEAFEHAGHAGPTT